MRQELMDELKTSIREDMPLILEGKDPYKTLNAGEVPLSDILEAVSKATDVSKRDIAGARKFQYIVTARWVFFLLASELTTKSLIEISVFVNKNHATVSNAITRAKYLLPCDSALRTAHSRARDILNV